MPHLVRSLALAALVPVVAFAAAPAPSEEAIHACPDGRGGIVYQGDPCPDRPPARRAVPRPPAPTRAAPTRPMASHVPRPLPAPAAAPARRFVPYRGDPRWATPASTWRTFAAAMRGGDRDVAIACLTPAARADVGARIRAMGPDQMRGVVADGGRIHEEGDLGPYWSIRILRAGVRPKWVLFERTPTGAFKIAAL